MRNTGAGHLTETGHIAVGDARLSYLRAGDRPGIPLVLVHGYLGSTADWARVLPALAADRPVFAYDHRGHGGSTKFGAATAYSLDTLGADMRGILDATGVERFDLLGHSLGGLLAQRYTLDHPERVRSLILMDTAPAPAWPRLTRFALAGASLLVRGWGMRPVAGFVRLVTGRGDPELRQRQLAAMAAADPAAFVQLGRELTGHPSLRDRLGEIACPTTVIVGERDRPLRGGARDLAAGIPGAQLKVIAGAGHTPQNDRPTAWLAVVREHLRAG